MAHLCRRVRDECSSTTEHFEMPEEKGAQLYDQTGFHCGGLQTPKQVCDQTGFNFGGLQMPVLLCDQTGFDFGFHMPAQMGFDFGGLQAGFDFR
eukprot:693065-Amphidinium_carterae.1